MRNVLSKVRNTILFTMILFFSISITTFAEEDGINEIAITVSLNSDGSADITETWDIDNVYDGTEYYKALYNMDRMSVSNLTVTDDTGWEYQLLSRWDTSASFADKAYKCGILENKKGYELCWGISEMGDRTYTISYHLTGLVKRYSDSDGFYHQFISDDLSSSPRSASVEVYMDGVPFTTDNADIWALGFEGGIHFENGIIVARSDGKLGGNDYINLLIGFDTSVFEPITASGTFADVKDKAIAEEKQQEMILLIIIAILLSICLLVFIIAVLVRRNIRLADGTRTRRISVRNTEQTSVIPFGNDIAAVYSAVGLEYSLTTHLSLIAAYLVKWQFDGNLSFESEALANGKQGDLVILLTSGPEQNKNEMTLFSFLEEASEDGVLTLHSWQEWTQKHYKKIEMWENDVKKSGNNRLSESGWAAVDTKGKLRFTQTGYDMHVRMQGFFKYLKSFKKPDGNMSAVREYWGDYLVYASLFNLADNVAGGLQSMDADGFDDFCGCYHMNTFLFLRYIHHSYSYSNTVAESAAAGDGGSSYASGGGGFSGGGGGGSR